MFSTIVNLERLEETDNSLSPFGRQAIYTWVVYAPNGGSPSVTPALMTLGS